jgi:plastocyanin
MHLSTFIGCYFWRGFGWRLSLVACCVLLARCGGSPSSPSEATATIRLTTAGLVPAEVRIPVGGKVLFVNDDARTHAMSSDPVQVHTDCPPLNDVGSIAPGQSRSTGALTVARSCGFHDHLNEFDDTWKGRIIVQ